MDLNSYSRTLDTPYPLEYGGAPRTNLGDQELGDTDDIVGRTPREAGDEFNLATVNLPINLSDQHKEDLQNYITSSANLAFMRRNFDNIHEWEKEQIENSREAMDSGDLPSMSGLDMNFFHIHNNNNQRETRYNFHTWDNDDQTYGDMPPYMERVYDDIQNEFDNVDTMTDSWLGEVQGGNDEWSEYLNEAIYSESFEREDFNDGTAYWYSDFGRHPTHHPNFDFMYDELLEQDRLIEDDEGEPRAPTEEEEEDGRGDLHERIYGDNPESIRGYRTSVNLMSEYLQSIREAREEVISDRNAFLSRFLPPVATNVDIPQEETVNRTGEEDIIQLNAPLR